MRAFAQNEAKMSFCLKGRNNNRNTYDPIKCFFPPYIWKCRTPSPLAPQLHNQHAEELLTRALPFWFQTHIILLVKK